jgi:hypothetical protein
MCMYMGCSGASSIFTWAIVVISLRLNQIVNVNTNVLKRVSCFHIILDAPFMA